MSAVYGTSVLATAGSDALCTIAELEAAWFGAELFGTAFTVRGVGGDNLALHRALAEVESGQVLVADVGGHREAGHWGELMTIAARHRGLAGVVIDGSVRDRLALARLGFPVFHLGVAPRPATKREPGELNVPVEIRGRRIEPGDLVVADADGVVAVPAGQAARVLEAAAELERREAEIAARLEQGETTMHVLGL
jgi:4-hydroxy-4-methyl-2-oxoglutarate aldolase